MKKVIFGIILGMGIMGIVYSAPQRIDNPEMAQKREGKQLRKEISKIKDIDDVKEYLLKLTNLVVLE